MRKGESLSVEPKITGGARPEVVTGEDRGFGESDLVNGNIGMGTH